MTTAIQGIRLAMQTALSNIGIRTFNTLPRTVNEFPCALIFPRAGDFDMILQRSTSRPTFEVTLLIGAWGDVEKAQDTADDYLLPSGTTSVKAAIEGGSYSTYASYARVVRWRDYGPIQFGSPDALYLGMRFDVETR